MKIKMKLLPLFLSLFFLTVSGSFGQGGYGNQSPVIGYGPTLPAACNPSAKNSSLYYKTGASAGLYFCSASNIWSALGGASVGSPVSGGTANQVFYGGAGGSLAQSSNLTFNGTNAGIGTTPTAANKLTILETSASAGTTGVQLQNLRSNGYTEFRVMNDGGAGRDASFGIGGTATGDNYQNRGYFYADSNLDGLMYATIKNNTDIKFYTSGSAAGQLRFTINNAGVTTAGTTATGGIRTGFVTVSTNYTALATDHTICANSTSGALTVTLPTAAGRAGQEYVVKDCNGTSSSNNVTIATTGGELIDGATTKAISMAYGAFTIQSSGTKYVIY